MKSYMLIRHTTNPDRLPHIAVFGGKFSLCGVVWLPGWWLGDNTVITEETRVCKRCRQMWEERYGRSVD